LEAENNPEEEIMTYRKVLFLKNYTLKEKIFKKKQTKKFFRLTLGTEVRLKNAYIIKGENVIKDADGNITEIHATYDLDSKSGSGTEASQRKVKGTIHWVSIPHAIKAEVRLYDRLFTHENPDGDKEVDFKEYINPNSLEVITGFVEPSLQLAQPEDKFQFQRLGYFCVDKDSSAQKNCF
jgi:glutaminyl-tRNA synthetase